MPPTERLSDNARKAYFQWLLQYPAASCQEVLSHPDVVCNSKKKKRALQDSSNPTRIREAQESENVSDVKRSIPVESLVLSQHASALEASLEGYVRSCTVSQEERREKLFGVLQEIFEMVSERTATQHFDKMYSSEQAEAGKVPSFQKGEAKKLQGQQQQYLRDEERESSLQDSSGDAELPGQRKARKILSEMESRRKTAAATTSAKEEENVARVLTFDSFLMPHPDEFFHTSSMEGNEQKEKGKDGDASKEQNILSKPIADETSKLQKSYKVSDPREKVAVVGKPSRELSRPQEHCSDDEEKEEQGVSFLAEKKATQYSMLRHLMYWEMFQRLRVEAEENRSAGFLDEFRATLKGMAICQSFSLLSRKCKTLEISLWSSVESTKAMEKTFKGALEGKVNELSTSFWTMLINETCFELQFSTRLLIESEEKSARSTLLNASAAQRQILLLQQASGRLYRELSQAQDFVKKEGEKFDVMLRQHREGLRWVRKMLEENEDRERKEIERQEEDSMLLFSAAKRDEKVYVGKIEHERKLFQDRIGSILREHEVERRRVKTVFMEGLSRKEVESQQQQQPRHEPLPSAATMAVLPASSRFSDTTCSRRTVHSRQSPSQRSTSSMDEFAVEEYDSRVSSRSVTPSMESSSGRSIGLLGSSLVVLEESKRTVLKLLEDEEFRQIAAIFRGFSE